MIEKISNGAESALNWLRTKFAVLESNPRIRAGCRAFPFILIAVLSVALYFTSKNVIKYRTLSKRLTAYSLSQKAAIDTLRSTLKMYSDEDSISHPGYLSVPPTIDYLRSGRKERGGAAND